MQLQLHKISGSVYKYFTPGFNVKTWYTLHLFTFLFIHYVMQSWNCQERNNNNSESSIYGTTLDMTYPNENS